jgi:hypothetical protein
MLQHSIDYNAQDAKQSPDEIRKIADRLVTSLGYNTAICTAMEFQWFNVAEELRFMQDEYNGYV